MPGTKKGTAPSLPPPPPSAAASPAAPSAPSANSPSPMPLPAAVFLLTASAAASASLSGAVTSRSPEATSTFTCSRPLASLVELMVASVPPVNTPARGALLVADPGNRTLAWPSCGTITRSPAISVWLPDTGIATPSRMTTVPGVAFDSDPMPAGAAAGVAEAAAAAPMGATGRTVACARITGVAALLSAPPAIEEIVVLASAMAASSVVGVADGATCVPLFCAGAGVGQGARKLLIYMEIFAGAMPR